MTESDSTAEAIGAGGTPTPRWVLFDAVGTLIYPEPAVAVVYHAAGQRFGSGLSPAEVATRLRSAMHVRQRLQVEGAADSLERPATSEVDERERWREVVASVFADVPDAGGELFESLWRHFAQPRHWRLFGDVPAAFDRLRQQGCRLGIASNFDSRLHAIVRSQPCLAACEAVLVSSEIGYAKPDRRFFLAALERIEASPQEVLLVGDDELNDIVGAAAAGWQVLRVDRKRCDLASAVENALRGVPRT